MERSETSATRRRSGADEGPPHLPQCWEMSVARKHRRGESISSRRNEKSRSAPVGLRPTQAWAPCGPLVERSIRSLAACDGGTAQRPDRRRRAFRDAVRHAASHATSVLWREDNERMTEGGGQFLRRISPEKAPDRKGRRSPPAPTMTTAGRRAPAGRRVSKRGLRPRAPPRSQRARHPPWFRPGRRPGPCRGVRRRPCRRAPRTRRAPARPHRSDP